MTKDQLEEDLRQRAFDSGLSYGEILDVLDLVKVGFEMLDDEEDVDG